MTVHIQNFFKQKNEYIYYILFPLAVFLCLPLESARLLSCIEYTYSPELFYVRTRWRLCLSYLVADFAGHFLYWSQGWEFPCLDTCECYTSTCEMGKMTNAKKVGGKVTEGRSTSTLMFVIFICNTLGPSFKLQYFYTQDTVMHNPYFNFLLLQPHLK